LVGWVALAFRSRQSLQAEVLFLRRQLALYLGRDSKPRRIDAATRVSLAWLSRLFQWRSALVVMRPQTLIRWHRADVQQFDMSVLLVPEEPRMPRRRPADTILHRVVIAMLPKEQRQFRPDSVPRERTVVSEGQQHARAA